MQNLKKIFGAQDMTVGKPLANLAAFSIPLLIGNLAQQMYNTVDTIVVGQYCGDSALAAVGATDWCYWLILWSVTNLTQAFSTFVARAFGRGDYRQMNKVIAMSVLLSAVIGAVLTLGGLRLAKAWLLGAEYRNAAHEGRLVK